MAKSTINPTVYNQLYRNQVNRGEQTREDDDYIKIPEITIYDVDYSILQYIRNSIKPEVQDRDRMIDVPVMYGSGELWSQIQSNGFMRDEKNKLLCPVITLSRTRMEEYKDFAKLDVNNRVSSRVYYRQGYTQNNARYGSNNRGSTDLPQKEIYITLIPEYYYVYYDLNIWTDFNEQLNKIVEMFIPVNNFVWGNDYQFVTNIEDFSFSTVNISKQERIVKASTRLRVLATLMPAFVERKSSIQKALSIKKVSVAERVINDQNIVESQPSRVRVPSRIALQANLNSFSTLSADINFVQKLQSTLAASASVTASALITKLPQASLLATGTTTANLTVNAPSASLLLDLYPNAAAAYSLRKLRTAYTGSAIRVRRSSDNTEQDIGFVADQLDTVSLLAFCGVGNGFVTTWYDQSGNARNASQTTQANQPRIVSSGSVIIVNNKAGISFTNTNIQYLNITNSIFTYTGNSTLFHVSRNRSNISGNWGGIIGQGTDLSGQSLAVAWKQFPNTQTRATTDVFGPGGVTTSNTQNINTQYLATFKWENWSTHKTNGNTIIAINGVNQALTAYGINPNSLGTAPIYIGAFAINPGYQVESCFLGDIQEIVVYTTAFLQTNIDGAETNINTHYGIY